MHNGVRGYLAYQYYDNYPTGTVKVSSLSVSEQRVSLTIEADLVSSPPLRFYELLGF